MAKWFTPRALRLHLTLLVLLPAFVWLWWWQLHRALGGNELSWAYTFEWPIFCGYAVFLWWRLLHEDFPKLPRLPRRVDNAKSARAATAAAQVEAERLAYNRYLAALNDEDAKGHGATGTVGKTPQNRDSTLA